MRTRGEKRIFVATRISDVVEVGAINGIGAWGSQPRHEARGREVKNIKKRFTGAVAGVDVCQGMIVVRWKSPHHLPIDERDFLMGDPHMFYVAIAPSECGARRAGGRWASLDTGHQKRSR